jgi:hypothetical protein
MQSPCVKFPLARGRVATRRVFTTVETLAPRDLSFDGADGGSVSKKRKTLKERTREALGRAKRGRLRDLLTKTSYADEIGSRVREIVASKALALTDDPKDAALRRAFKEFRLDPIDPFDWRELLNIFADLHFEEPPPRERGARPKWDEHRRLLFQTHLAGARRNARRRGYPALSHDDLADYLRYVWPEFYRTISQVSLRKYIVAGPPAGRRPKGEK